MEPNKAAEDIHVQPEIDLTLLGKVNYHGPPSLNFEITQKDVEQLNDELRRKDEMINRLVSNMQLYMGKIKGYQTLGHLYHESKQECIRYKQKNEELANRLDIVMKRLLPERDNAPVIAASPLESSVIYTTAGEVLHVTPLENSKELQRPSKIHIDRPLEDKEVDSIHSSAVGLEAGHKIQDGSFQEVEKDLSSGEDKMKESPRGSSASSPSFVCIGGSGLSSMEQTPTRVPLPEETIGGANSRPTFVDESLTDTRTLNDFLNDPKSSSELRAMAADLLRVGRRAAKIEKQARIQQDLLNELQKVKSSLEEEARTKQHKLQDIQEKYSLAMEKLQIAELEKDPSAATSITDAEKLRSSDWVKVDNETKTESVHFQSDVVASFVLTEMKLRSQIHQLETQVTELEITNRNLTDEREHGERARRQLLLKVQDLEKQVMDQERNDLKRQQEFDEMLLALKNRREELELEKEEALDQHRQEKIQRMKVEGQCLTLQGKISQLESKIYQLERQKLRNPMEAIRSPPPAKGTEPSLSTSPSGDKNLLTELTILQQQVTIYKEDFDHERRDRELAQSQLAALKLQLEEAKSGLESAQRQIKLLTNDLRDARNENFQLKKKFSQTMDELKGLKTQIRPVPHNSQRPHHPNLFAQSWICRMCTFENPGVRHSCEICGAEVSRAAMFRISPEPGMDLTGRDGSQRTPVQEHSYLHPLEDDPSARQSSRKPPKL